MSSVYFDMSQTTLELFQVTLRDKDVERSVVFQGLKVFNFDKTSMYPCSRNAQVIFVKKLTTIENNEFLKL